ncbi:hypothetical protein C7476_115128 [Phyllobacterium bourgognense]|uniref:Uncharacterized protein n=1 Tax=Phyllobacterium bourgognense TaxID=314236 RepID=A0A368YIV4_9HYPH|nr:hypothetical protein C7476_115128 [Phyllobacterium bourgognense]
MFLSIDIDGNDWHVWNGLKNDQPRLIVVEFNPSASNDLYFVQDADPRRIVAGLYRAREVQRLRTGSRDLCQCVFVQSKDFKRVKIADNSIDAIYEPYMDLQICQGFDGTIFAAGHMWLNWHGIKLEQEDFQILPRHLRKYPRPRREGCL